jgi:hypothetical protein
MQPDLPQAFDHLPRPAPPHRAIEPISCRFLGIGRRLAATAEHPDPHPWPELVHSAPTRRYDARMLAGDHGADAVRATRMCREPVAVVVLGDVAGAAEGFGWRHGLSSLNSASGPSRSSSHCRGSAAAGPAKKIARVVLQPAAARR